MFKKQLHQFAKDADLATDLAYTNGRKAYGKGKSLLHLVSKQAQSAAKQARKSEIAHHLMDALPAWQAQLNSLWVHAKENAGRTYSTLGRGLCTSEHAILKLTLGYLAIKWFKNRDKDIHEMAHEVRAHVVEKPITSVVIVLTIGYVLGKLRK